MRAKYELRVLKSDINVALLCIQQVAVWSVPKLGTELLEYFEPVLDSVGTVLRGCVIIYAINYVLVCMRPEMAMDFGSTKWNQCLVSGLPMDNPLLGFGTAKNSPGLH